MVDIPRKKSPRAPSISLDEALERVGRAYDKEGLHPAPTDVVAQHIGYKGANGGAALAALASLRYYGLIERPRDGVLAVAKNYEAFRFSPNRDLKRSFLLSFLRTPSLFAELIDQYVNGFPSDATLKYELIQRGFLPAAATSLVAVLKRSIEFVGLVEAPEAEKEQEDEEHRSQQNGKAIERRTRPAAITSQNPDEEGCDRIPVRLSGNRRAWLLIPGLFYSADKQHLKAQIDLLLTEDDEAL